MSAPQLATEPTASNASEAFTPLMLVYPDLAAQLGVDEAIFISQLDYWLKRAKCVRLEDGLAWVWNTIDDWLQQFTWMSRSKLERVIARLEDIGVLLSQKFWKHGWNHTKHYRLDYKKLQEDYGWIPVTQPQPKSPQPEPVKMPETITSECGDRFRQNDGFKYIEYKTEITSKKTHIESVCDFSEPEPEPEASEEPPTSLPDLEEPGISHQSLASLIDKPKIRNKLIDPLEDKCSAAAVVCETQTLQDDSVISETQTLQDDSVVSETQKLQGDSVVRETRELLANPVFIQWWCDRVEKSSISQTLYLTSKAFVKTQIRKQPEVAADMYEGFQVEMTRRIENANTRQQNGIALTSTERDELAAILPYSTASLLTEAAALEGTDAIAPPQLPPPGSEMPPDTYQVRTARDFDIADGRSAPPPEIVAKIRAQLAERAASKAQKPRFSRGET